jgi:hypothetical protein
MTRQSTVVLVVDQDPEPRQRVAGWLREAGYEVLTCPGPVAPSYTCAGGRGELCPLARAAEVVVLNLELASDTVMKGTPALTLLCYYLGLGKAVVALGRPGDSIRPFQQERVVMIAWPPERRALLRAVAHHVIDATAAHPAPPA